MITIDGNDSIVDRRKGKTILTVADQHHNDGNDQRNKKKEAPLFEIFNSPEKDKRDDNETHQVPALGQGVFDGNYGYLGSNGRHHNPGKVNKQENEKRSKNKPEAH